jgi:hypothetical protein
VVGEVVTDDYAAESAIYVEQIDGDGQLVHFITITDPREAKRRQVLEAHLRGVPLDRIQLTPVEV